MFTPARYVIVDDNPDELRQLADSLQRVGAPCLALHYDEAEGVKTGHLSGVRLLFLDLHLTTGAQSGNIAQVAAVIIEMLEAGITPAAPYVIILWTKHEEQKADFEAYLMEHLGSMKRPIAILSLDKKLYLGAGKSTPDVGTRLTDDVARVIGADPRLRALLDWEREVLKAAGSTLAEIGTLVTAEDRNATRFSARLDEILSLLASEAVGAENAKADPYSAVNAALMPILSDRIANQRTSPGSAAIWSDAVTKIDDVPLPSIEVAARLNTMLHLASATTEEASPGAWGAVSLLPDAELGEEPMLRRFDIRAKAMMADVFCLLEKHDRRASKLCLLRIGASCDYAQSRKGPVPFVLGAIVSANAPRRLSAIPQAEFATPPVILDGFEGPVRILFNVHLQVSLVPADFKGWQPLCRLREPLLMQVTNHGARHSTRPAIISFRPGSQVPVVTPEVDARSQPEL